MEWEPGQQHVEVLCLQGRMEPLEEVEGEDQEQETLAG